MSSILKVLLIKVALIRLESCPTDPNVGSSTPEDADVYRSTTFK
jgi:hypothetical protein